MSYLAMPRFPGRYGAVWEIAFILEEQGFFTHKDTKSLHPNIPNNDSHSGDETNTQSDESSTKKSQGRRKRSF
jgi:hypothetical protein